MNEKNGLVFKIIGVLFVASLVEVGAASMLKVWSKNKQRGFLIGGMALYLVIAGLFAYTLTIGDLSTTNGIWQALAFIVVTLMAVWFFGERPNVWEWAGLAVVCVGLVLLVVGGVVKEKS